MKNQTLEVVMDGLMRRYIERVPDVKKITSAMVAHNIIKSLDDIENDHVAFRTLGIDHLGIQSFEKMFLKLGYSKKDYFNFEGKKLNAYWYAPPTDKFPRIFLSELRVDTLSEKSQKIIKKYTQNITSDPVDNLNLDNGFEIDNFLHSPLWNLPSWQDYQDLQTESEYAAWVIYNRYYLNHYTISVHNLPDGYNDIYDFNIFLENLGIKLNNSGSVVKVSPDGNLLQSSTVAEMIRAKFSEGTEHEISGSYVEFAERKILPQYKNLAKSEIKRIHRREGFETNNADKIFESTFSTQTNRKS